MIPKPFGSFEKSCCRVGIYQRDFPGDHRKSDTARPSEVTSADVQARAFLEAVAEAAVAQATTQSMLAVLDENWLFTVREV